MKIGIVGAGFVGHAMARAFMEHAEIRTFDVLPERATHSLKEVMECDFVLVCLPTPKCEDSDQCDLSILDEFFSTIAGHDGIVVLKSTVPVGTTNRFSDVYRLPKLIHSPEFLTARCAVVDAQLPARNLVGWSSSVDSQDAAWEFAGVLEDRFPGVQCFIQSSYSTEMVKLMSNNFFAVKVAFFNEMYRLCEAIGDEIIWDEMLEAVLADGRISHAHTRVPGPDGRFGYGGACLTKDLSNTLAMFAEFDLHSPLLEGTKQSNAIVREPDSSQQSNR